MQCTSSSSSSEWYGKRVYGSLTVTRPHIVRTVEEGVAAAQCQRIDPQVSPTIKLQYNNANLNQYEELKKFKFLVLKCLLKIDAERNLKEDEFVEKIDYQEPSETVIKTLKSTINKTDKFFKDLLIFGYNQRISNYNLNGFWEDIVRAKIKTHNPWRKISEKFRSIGDCTAVLDRPYHIGHRFIAPVEPSYRTNNSQNLPKTMEILTLEENSIEKFSFLVFKCLLEIEKEEINSQNPSEERLQAILRFFQGGGGYFKQVSDFAKSSEISNYHLGQFWINKLYENLKNNEVNPLSEIRGLFLRKKACQAVLDDCEPKKRRKLTNCDNTNFQNTPILQPVDHSAGFEFLDPNFFEGFIAEQEQTVEETNIPTNSESEFEEFTLQASEAETSNAQAQVDAFADGFLELGESDSEQTADQLALTQYVNLETENNHVHSTPSSPQNENLACASILELEEYTLQLEPIVNSLKILSDDAFAPTEMKFLFVKYFKEKVEKDYPELSEEEVLNRVAEIVRQAPTTIQKIIKSNRVERVRSFHFQGYWKKYAKCMVDTKIKDLFTSLVTHFKNVRSCEVFKDKVGMFANYEYIEISR